MLSTKLWNLQATIAQVYHGLLHALHLIAKDHGITASVLGIAGKIEVLQLRGSLYLLDALDEIAVLLKLSHSLLRLFKVSPRHAVLASEGCLVYLRIGRTGRNPA